MSEIESLLPEFIAECEDAVKAVQTSLDQLSQDPSGPFPQDVLDSIFRGIHTLKGGAGMFGFMKTVERSHALENLINKARQERRPLTSNEIDQLRAESLSILELIRNKEQEPQAGVGGVDASGFVRVPIANVAGANKLVSEIFLVRNQILFLVEKLKSKSLEPREFFHEWDSLDGTMRRNLRDLSRIASSMQMTTARNLFSRMKGVVENYVAKTGKKIFLETAGEATELDKKVADVLGEPLVHLVRNAIDHGIESPHERMSGGKPEHGVVRIEAHTDSNQIVLTVSDDGRGMDAGVILKKAQERGMDVHHLRTQKEIFDLILLPGFSTAEQVTEISGRGVGMDAVNVSVQNLGGQIEIESEPGRGSRFHIHLPLAVSVSTVLIFEVRGQLYATPSAEVRSAQTRPAQDLRPSLNGLCVRDGDLFVPCLDLESFFGSEFEAEFKRQVHIVNLEGGGCARVTRLLENTELVIKPLPSVFPKTSFITGVSLLPTGQPVFLVSLKRAFQGWLSQMKEQTGSVERGAA